MPTPFSYQRVLSSAAAEPRHRTLLVGTALSISQLHHALALARPRPSILGCVLDAPADRSAAADLPCPLLGDLADLAEALTTHRPDQVLISLPVSRAAALRDAGERCDLAGVRWRFMPTLADQLAGRITARGPVAGAIDFAQLIDREPRPLDEGAIAGYLAGRRVLITGAGGSIGSELARIVARFGPSQLILVERGENALFEIDREIAHRFPHVPRAAELHDVTLRDATLRLVERRRPDVILHAAAHKHVPMMEDHPAAAVENNFLGTRAIADAAQHQGVGRFVMISTDKAVNPSSVMGATKRLAELYVQHLASRRGPAAPGNPATPGAPGKTVFSMVRFGNVLGSACSVLPIWSDQLARGGPITVTHPDMSRYFMTIPEAAGLVLQAGALAEGGEVFLLDMGEPVRILDLAHRFLRSQGYEPGVDVAIAFTGVRPGEKLFEELAYESEDMRPTEHAAIRIWKTAPPDPAHLRQIAATFDRLRQKPDGDGGSHPWAGVTRESILNALRAAIPEMVTAAAG